MSASGWVSPRTTIFPGGYPGWASKEIAAHSADPGYTLAYEGSKMTEMALPLGDEKYLANAQKSVLEEIGNALGFTKVARGHLDDIETAMAELKLAQLPATFEEAKALAAQSGNLGLLDAMLGAKRAIIPTWNWQKPGDKMNDVARYMADGSMFAEDAAIADLPRVTAIVPEITDEVQIAKMGFDGVRPGMEISTSARKFHTDGSMLMHLDNVVARTPVDVTNPIPNFEEVLSVRRLLKEYNDAVTYGTKGTAPDLAQARSLLDKMDAMLEGVLNWTPGVTLEEGAKTKAMLEGAAAETLRVGRNIALPVVAGAAVAGLVIGGLASLGLMRAKSDTASSDANGVPKGATIASKGGLKIDEHRGLRGAATMAGVGLVAAAGAALVMSSIHRSPMRSFLTQLPWLKPAAIGAAVGGAALAGVGLVAFRPKTKDYVAKVEGSRADAAREAAKREGGDIGIVALSKKGDSWGLVSLGGAAVDRNGAGSVKISNPPVKFASIVSREGDEWQLSGGSFVNAGNPSAVDSSTLSATSDDDIKSLVGAKIGADSSGASLQIGERLTSVGVAKDTSEAMLSLFEAGIHDAALVNLKGGVVAFGLHGEANRSDLHARGTGIKSLGDITIVSNDAAISAGQAGGAFAESSTKRAIIDTTKIKVADVDELKGKRIAMNGTEIVRLDKPTATYTSADKARDAVAATGKRTLLVQLQDGVAAFALPGSTSAELETAIGPVSKLTIVIGKKAYSVADGGDVAYADRSVPFDAGEPIGSKLSFNGASGVAKSVLGSYATKEEARKAVAGDLSTTTTFALIQAKGPAGQFHAYELQPGTSGAAWDPELGKPTMVAWRDPDVRTVRDELERHPAEWGDDVYHFRHEVAREVRFLEEDGRRSEVAATPEREISRTLTHIDRAFDPNEAEGSSVRVRGVTARIDHYIGSADSMYGARNIVPDDANDDETYVVLSRANNAGQYHVYRADEGGWGSSWDESRANAELISFTRRDSETHDERESRSGTYGTDYQHYDVTTSWTERIEVSEDRGEHTVDETPHHETSRRETHLDRAPKPRDPDPPSNHSTSDGDSHTGGSGSTSYDPPETHSDPEPDHSNDTWTDPDAEAGDM